MRRPLRGSRLPVGLLALAIMVGILAAGLHYTRAAFSDKETVSASFQAGVWQIATVDIKPESLQKKSKGEPITAFIELATGYDVRDIKVATLRLCLGTARCTDGVPADSDSKIGDADKDGILDLKVTFPREGVLRLVQHITPPTTVTFTIWGEVGSTVFAGSDQVKLVDPEKEPKEKEPTATPSTTPAGTARPTASPSATPTAMATATPKVSPSITATPRATPQATKSPTATVSRTTTATSTPTATPKTIRN